MKYGMNLLMWTDSLSPEHMKLAEQLRDWGFDLVEIPIFENNPDAFVPWGKRLDELGLGRTASVVRMVGENPMSPDAAERRKGIDANKKTVDCCAAMGAETLIGPFHSALGHFSGSPTTEDEWRWAVDSMREVAEHAETCNVKLALEAVNRFECYLMNCAETGARFVRDVNHPACGMMYDTFHAHIEEKNVTQAIRELKDCLYHVHISENDRGTPGEGQVRWDETFDALKEIEYNGNMVIEAFGSSLPLLTAAAKIWRKFYESEEQLARDGLAFTRGHVEKRW